MIDEVMLNDASLDESRAVDEITAPDDSTAPDESAAPDESTVPDESMASDESAAVDKRAVGTSQKKIEGNRRNAQLSTGPRTPVGKKIVAGNARKHGLLERNLVIASGDGTEDQEEFDSLMAEMRDCYKPVGIAEDLLVQELANSTWRSARALRCERGELSLRSTISNEKPRLSEVEISMILQQPYREARDTLRGSSRGLTYLLERIEEAKDDVATVGCVRPENSQRLTVYLGGYWEDNTSKRALLAALEKHTQELNGLKLEIEERELQQRNAKLDSDAIPSRETLDRIQRYETANVRHRYKVEARLERLQAQRKENAKAMGHPAAMMEARASNFTKQSQ